MLALESATGILLPRRSDGDVGIHMAWREQSACDHHVMCGSSEWRSRRDVAFEPARKGALI